MKKHLPTLNWEFKNNFTVTASTYKRKKMQRIVCDLYNTYQNVVKKTISLMQYYEYKFTALALGTHFLLMAITFYYCLLPVEVSLQLSIANWTARGYGFATHLHGVLIRCYVCYYTHKWPRQMSVLKIIILWSLMCSTIWY